jgi:hypothetical protein
MDGAAQFNEADLLTDYTALRQRTAALEEQVPAYLQRISETLHRIGGESELANHHRSLLVCARGNAMMAIENYHQAFPFLQTAESLVEQLAKPTISFEGAEWRDGLLQRLDELVGDAAFMIAEAESRFGEAKDIDPAAVPQSILDV